MIRGLIVAIVVCLFVVLGATAVGHALDSEAQDRVIFTQNGQTTDCAREVRDKLTGDVYYIDCHPVVYP